MSESLRKRHSALAGRGLPARGRGADPRGARLPTGALQPAGSMKGRPDRGDRRVPAEAIALRGPLPAGSRAAVASRGSSRRASPSPRASRSAPRGGRAACGAPRISPPSRHPVRHVIGAALSESRIVPHGRKRYMPARRRAGMAMSGAGQAHVGTVPVAGRGEAGAADAGAMLRGLEDLLRKAARSGRIDPGIPGAISDLRDGVRRIGSRWAQARTFDEFCMYQAAINVDFVLIQMEKGLGDMRDGGRTDLASDSLSVIPVVRRALRLAQSEPADPIVASDALAVTEDLMDASINAGLGTPLEEIYSKIDWDDWGDKLPLLMKRLGMSE